MGPVTLRAPGLRAAVLLLTALALPAACNKKAIEAKPEAGVAPGGLTPEQAAKPVARIGDKVITLGDFAQALQDMPEYERMRYQSLERRKELLKSMVEVHLLADEAKKLGLDKDPIVQEETRQILVAWMRGKLVNDLPIPASIPESELRAYYDKHIDLYREPERRRVSMVLVKDEAAAKKVHEEAKALPPGPPGATGWGALVKKHSEDKPNEAQQAPEMFGDIGYVTAPADTHAQPSPKATPEVRTAAFALKEVGEVSLPFKDANGWHVLRLLAKNAARDQSFADVERTLRVRILQEKRAAAEKALLDQVKTEVKVEIDEKALSELAADLALGPAPSTSVSSSSSVSGSVSGSASASAPPAPSVSASKK